MKGNFLSNLFSSFSAELPELTHLDAYLDFIIPQVKPWSEDLREEEFYLDTRWKELRDQDDFREAVLHIFREEGEYLNSIDGNITKGIWKVLPKSNTLIIERTNDDTPVSSELYDLAFLNKDFFILKKHGHHSRKYFCLAREATVRGLEWREAMELLYNNFRSNGVFLVTVVVIALIIGLFLVMSLG